jgi:hypothetical protein
MEAEAERDSAILIEAMSSSDTEPENPRLRGPRPARRIASARRESVGIGDVRGVQQRRGHLVRERGEQVEVVPVKEQNVDRLPVEGPGAR